MRASTAAGPRPPRRSPAQPAANTTACSRTRRTPGPLRTVAGRQTRRGRLAHVRAPGRTIRDLASPAPATQRIRTRPDPLTAQRDPRNKRSPRPSSSSPGSNRLISAPSPTARNKTSTIPRLGPDHPSPDPHFFIWAKKSKSTSRCRSASGRRKRPRRSPKTNAWPGSKSCSPATPNAALSRRRHPAAALRPAADQDRGLADHGDLHTPTEMPVSRLAKNLFQFPNPSRRTQLPPP